MLIYKALQTSGRPQYNGFNATFFWAIQPILTHILQWWEYGEAVVLAALLILW